MRSISKYSRSVIALLAAGLAAANAMAEDAPAPAPHIQILVVQGGNSTNTVDKQPQRPVVEVRDSAGNPVNGAAVTFSVPAYGPGVLFGNGSRQATVYTDETGRASAVAVKAVDSGTFTYQVAANYQGQSAETTIAQTNTETNTGASVEHHGSKKMLWYVLGAVAIAGGAGAAFALHGGGSGSAPTSTTATIGGSGSGATVGAPH